MQEEDVNGEDQAMEDADGEEEEDDEDDAEMEDAPEIPDDATILANKKAHPLFAKLFRSKGEYWLATRPGRAGEWSQAGAMLTLSGGRPWFCTIDRSEWETGNADIDAMVKHDIETGGTWGDRRQELVFIGEKLVVPAIEAVLDECLLTDDEFEQWKAIMMKGAGPNAGDAEEKAAKEEELAQLFDDGFPDWDDPDEHDEDEMDHDLQRHDSHHGESHAKANGKTKHGVKKDGTVY